eukprot:4721909-Karenia_brevis.AAC.1
MALSGLCPVSKNHLTHLMRSGQTSQKSQPLFCNSQGILLRHRVATLGLSEKPARLIVEKTKSLEKK